MRWRQLPDCPRACASTRPVNTAASLSTGTPESSAFVPATRRMWRGCCSLANSSCHGLPALELSALPQQVADRVLEQHLRIVRRAPAHDECERLDALVRQGQQWLYRLLHQQNRLSQEPPYV